MDLQKNKEDTEAKSSSNRHGDGSRPAVSHEKSDQSLSSSTSNRPSQPGFDFWKIKPRSLQCASPEESPRSRTTSGQIPPRRETGKQRLDGGPPKDVNIPEGKTGSSREDTSPRPQERTRSVQRSPSLHKDLCPSDLPDQSSLLSQFDPLLQPSLKPLDDSPRRSVPLMKDDSQRSLPLMKDDSQNSLPLMKDDSQRSRPLIKDDSQSSLPLMKDDSESSFLESTKTLTKQTEGNDFTLMKHLKELGLESYYPGKLKRKHLIKIFSSDIHPNTEEAKGMAFLKKLLNVNRKCRDIFSPEDDVDFLQEDDNEEVEDEGCNYHTAIMAIFMCADPFLRRYLVEKMLMCQFAVPFILPMTREMLLWPMRVMKNWNSAESGVVEGLLCKEKMPMLSVIQLGDFDRPMSSNMLNDIFQESGYEGFYSETCEGSNQIAEGLAEIAWYLPRGRKSDAFQRPFTAVNLHGDGRNCADQVNFLLEESSCTILVTYSVSEAEKLLKGRFTKKTIIALCASKSKVRQTLRSTNTQYTLFPLTHSSDVKKLTKTINEALFDTSRSLQDRASSSGQFNFSVDEEQPHCVEGKKLAEDVMADIMEQDLYKARATILPFQEHWKEWVRLDKEQTRRKNIVNMEMAQSFIEERELKKQEIEKKLDCKAQSKCFSKFLSYLRRAGAQRRFYFLEWLRLFLNERSQQILNEHQQKIDRQEGEDQLFSSLKKDLGNSSFGLEHFLRELGMFWMCMKRHNAEESSISWLPRLAAFLLLEGYPLEILDGDASYVPLEWIKQVFSCLKDFTRKNSKVLVTSILGVQSSGKSTFLNSMFGINFSVSSGRCTRGAFMQMVEVDEAAQKDLDCDYLLVVDTEGLKSAEQQGYDNEHDNELGTLAVGIADLSVMNIGGENDDSMKDVLQIICYAFLRMTVVLKERPMCMMVHQNVGDLAASMKTTTGKLKLFQNLDEMTKLAADMENCSNMFTKFADVIQYNPKKMDIYIPGLWQGSPPMASVNIDYSEAAEVTKTNLLQEISCKSASSLESFFTRIKDVNKAVKEENFIFSFQNTVAAKAFQNLSQYYEEKKWQGKTKVIDLLAKIELKLKAYGDHSNAKKDKVLAEGVALTDDYVKSLQNSLDAYFSEHEEYASILEHDRALFERDVASTRTQTEAEVRKRIEEMFYFMKNEEKVKKVMREGEKYFQPRLLELKQKYSIAKNELTEEQRENLRRDFDDEWSSFLNGLEQPEQRQGESVRNIMSNMMRGAITGHSHHLRDFRSTELKYFVTFDDVVLSREFRDFAERSSKKKLYDPRTWFNNERKMEEVSNKLLERAQFKVDGILRSCKENVRELTEPARRFREDFCHDIIIFASGLINKTEDRDFTFSKFCWVNLLQVVCNYAAQELEKMQKIYTTRNDPRKKLDITKTKYFYILLSSVKTGNHVKVFCSEITAGIIPGVQTQFEGLLRTVIHDECLELCNCKQLLWKMYIELHEKGDFEEYKSYLSNFKQYTLRWLREHLIQFLKSHDGKNSKIRFVALMRKKAEETLENFIQTIQEDQLLNSDYRVFLQSLQRVCLNKDIHVGLDQETIGRLDMLPIKDLVGLRKEVVDQLHSEGKASMRNMIDKLDVEKELHKIRPSMQEQLYGDLMCSEGEQCPFCGAPCSVIGPHKVHRADLHQPGALKGWRDVTTEILSTPICPVSLSLNRTFRCPETNWTDVPYRRYKEFFPNWYIPCDGNAASAKYWKMVLKDYNQQLADWYEAKPADIPESWKGYQWPVVKKDLEEVYDPKL